MTTHPLRMRLTHTFLIFLVSLALVATTGILSPTRTVAHGQDEAWAWPSGHPVAVVHGFDPPAQRWLPGHRGVDLDVEVGSVVYAPASGTVIYAGMLAGRNVVSIDTGTYRTAVEPVSPYVRVGDTVTVGQPVGTVDAGHSPGALHWGVRIGPDTYVNPLRMLVGDVVLKAWDR